MAYPKPLSEKALQRLYKESGLDERAQGFLHDFFAACANLYGAIELRSALALGCKRRLPAAIWIGKK